MNKMIGETINFFSSENNVSCQGKIIAIIILKNRIIYKVNGDSNDPKTRLEYLDSIYDHRKYHLLNIYVENNKDITDDFNIDLIGDEE